jgi:hypothetical protein
MAETVNFRTLQSAPLATTETALYTAPTGARCVIVQLNVCNRGTTAATVRVTKVIGGGATANANYIYYDTLIPPGDTLNRVAGDFLNAGDILRVWASNANITFDASIRETVVT